MSDVTTPDPEERPKASLDQLKKKQRVTRNVTITVTGDDGEPQEVDLVFQAISAKEFDVLKSRHKPTPEQKKQGLDYNPDSFAPILLSKTCIEPDMSEEDAQEIWESDNWNRGERMQLLMAAMEVCTRGLDIPFTSSD